MRAISSEDKGVTTLVVKSDIPKEQEEIFRNRFPEALKRIKALAEMKIKIKGGV